MNDDTIEITVSTSEQLRVALQEAANNQDNHYIIYLGTGTYHIGDDKPRRWWPWRKPHDIHKNTTLVGEKGGLLDVLSKHEEK